MGTVKYKYDLLSIGDVALDTFVVLDDAVVMKHPKKKDKKLLCLKYGDKIPVKTLFHSLGGNAANVVVGAKFMGLKTAIYSVLGSDETGERALIKFKNEKIETKYVEQQKNKDTNYSVILNHKGQRTILVYHDERSYKFPKVDPARFVYLTSMGHGCEKTYDSVLRYVKKSEAKLCFGPGTHQKKSGFSKIEKLIRSSYLFICNKEEAELIFKCHRGKNTMKRHIKSMLDRIKAMGPEVVVITNGPDGAYASVGNQYYYAPIIDVPVIATTGAGDSFSSGVVSALALGKSLKIALEWGTYNSTSVIGEIGAQNGLLTQSGIREYKRRYKNYQVLTF